MLIDYNVNANASFPGCVKAGKISSPIFGQDVINTCDQSLLDFLQINLYQVIIPSQLPVIQIVWTKYIISHLFRSFAINTKIMPNWRKSSS